MFFLKKNQDNPNTSWGKKIGLLGIIILTLFLIFIGGITRLTESGLSMVEWEPLRGIIPPISEQEWKEKFQRYQNYPEFKKKNFNFNLTNFKKIFFYEYLHRLMGRLLGISLLILFLILLFKRKINKIEIFHYLNLLWLLAIQGLLGWYMVQSGLVNNPYVSHYRLATHLSLAIFFLIYLTIIWLTIFTFKKNKYFKPKLTLNLLILFLVIQIILGALNSGLDAGLISNDFPKMFYNWIPWLQIKNFYTQNPDALLGDNPILIHFLHRYLGILLGIGLTIFALYHFFKVHLIELKIALLILFILSLTQPLVGIIITMKGIPIFLGSAHQMMAIFILLNLVYLRKRIKIN